MVHVNTLINCETIPSQIKDSATNFVFESSNNVISNVISNKYVGPNNLSNEGESIILFNILSFST